MNFALRAELCDFALLHNSGSPVYIMHAKKNLRRIDTSLVVRILVTSRENPQYNCNVHNPSVIASFTVLARYLGVPLSTGHQVL